MAAIYSPWSNAGAEYGVEENMATPQYEDGYDAAEGAGGPPEPEDSKAGDHGSGHMDMMAEAMSIINEQSQLIKSLTTQLTRTPDGDTGE